MKSEFGMMRPTKNPKTFNKSNTNINLPGISKTLKYSQTQRKPNKLSYIESINNITENIQYEEKNTFYLTKQQSKLKDILKKMNDDTMHMIDTIRPKRKIAKLSKEELALIADRQVQNSKKCLAIMQSQIVKLQERYSQIAEKQQYEEIANKIKLVRQQIEQIKGGNIGAQYQIDKDGKEIIKQYSQTYSSRCNILQKDKSMIDQRLAKIKNDNNRVVQQNNKIQLSIKDVDKKIQEHEQQYQAIKTSSAAEIKNKNNEATYRQRKYQIQAIKKKMDFQNSHLQHKYYKFLKDFEIKKVQCNDLAEKEQSLINQIKKSKEDIQLYELQIEKIKKQREEKNKRVINFLREERKNKSQFFQLNETKQIPRTISSIEENIKTSNMIQISEVTRKWQSEPFEAIEQNQKKQIKEQQKIDVSKVE